MARKYRGTEFSGWSIMWVFCMFDLPVRTRKEVRRATGFRNLLLDNGFCMKQFSVYMRSCPNLQASKNLTKKLKKNIPPAGSVVFLYITDKQYLMADSFLGKTEQENEEENRRKNGQLVLF
jgi:CRISPR-associated protein Cas2